MSIESALARNLDLLLDLPNVVDVALTERDGQDAILVFVSGKIPPGELAPHEQVPAFIDGYRTVVETTPSVG